MAEGKVVSLQLCVGHRESMDTRDQVVALTGTGLEGDRHANPQSHRQVLLMEKEILDSLDLKPGTIRENVTISGLPIHQLPAGQRLHIGDEVVLEITGLCEPCSRMDEIRAGLRETLDGKRGVLTRVLQGGVLQVGDRIALEVPSLSR